MPSIEIINERPISLVETKELLDKIEKRDKAWWIKVKIIENPFDTRDSEQETYQILFWLTINPKWKTYLIETEEDRIKIEKEITIALLSKNERNNNR